MAGIYFIWGCAKNPYYSDPTEGLIVALKGDLDGMFTVPALGLRIQMFYDRGHDVTALIEIYNQMTNMNLYDVPNINDYHCGITIAFRKPDYPTLDSFNQSTVVR